MDLRVPRDRVIRLRTTHARPTERNDMKKLTVPVFAVLAAAGIAASIYSVFFQAPLQYGLTDDGKLNGSSLFFNQKIFYFHTAHAMLMIVAVVVAGVASILFLLSRGPSDGGLV